jgi:hypothetical protein
LIIGFEELGPSVHLELQAVFNERLLELVYGLLGIEQSELAFT